MGTYTMDRGIGRRVLMALGILLLGSVGVGWFGRVALANGWFDAIDEWVTSPSISPGFAGFLGALGQSAMTKGVIVAALVFLIVLLLRKRYVEATVFFGAALSAAIAQSVLKDWVGRARPNDLLLLETGSFPSGQAMVSVGIYGLFSCLLMRSLSSNAARRAVGTITVIYILLIGWGRLVLEEHYLTDVIAGHVLGLVWLATGVWVSGGYDQPSARLTRSNVTLSP